MSGKAVIRAAQMFTTNGVASRTSVAKEIVIGLTLGIGAGLVWQTYHWNLDHKWENYYKSLEAKK